MDLAGLDSYYSRTRDERRTISQNVKRQSWASIIRHFFAVLQMSRDHTLTAWLASSRECINRNLSACRGNDENDVGHGPIARTDESCPKDTSDLG